jgi:hypothetical protein
MGPAEMSRSVRKNGRKVTSLVGRQSGAFAGRKRKEIADTGAIDANPQPRSALETRATARKQAIEGIDTRHDDPALDASDS